METPTITVLIVDDEALVRAALAEYIASADDLVLAGTCSTGVEAVKAVRADPPDVVLMDLNMPEMNGYRATELIRQISPSTKVLGLTNFADDQATADFVRHGGAGLVAKIAQPLVIRGLIRNTHAGLSVLQEGTAKRLAAALPRQPKPQPELSSRERNVLEAVVAGLKNATIASRLNYSQSTVKGDIRALMRKLGVNGRSQLVAQAIELRLVKR